jgi:hypothetical protein
MPDREDKRTSFRRPKVREAVYFTFAFADRIIFKDLKTICLIYVILIFFRAILLVKLGFIS